MSVPRTVFLGLLLGALSASLLQGCDTGCGEYPCPRPELRPFLSGLYRGAGAPDVLAPVPEAELSFTLGAARTRASERYVREGRRVETEYEVVGVEAVDATRSGTR